MRTKLTIFFLLVVAIANAQTNLTIEGQKYTNSDDTWLGVNIQRNVQTKLIFKNNSITSINRYGYLLQAGDESPTSTNNKLDGAVISGNRLSWSGSDMKVIPHGIFTGHNSNVVVKYNYLNYVPMGIIRKSGNNMSNTGGGVAYNIVKGGCVGMVIKGMSNVNIYNNTFYNDRTTSETWRPLVHIYTNTDAGRYSVAHGTKIYNNIFYTKYQTFAITIDDNESLKDLKCDYNIYWSESGSPRFSVNGSTKSFSEWQAMGYDAHSVVLNPKFKDFTNFVPSVRLDYGTDLGPEWKDGLAINAQWGTTDPATTSQNGKWQVGAVIYAGTATTVTAPEYVNSVINGNAPAVIEMTYNSALSNILPAASAFTVLVNSVPGTVNSVSISGTKVILTLQNPVVNGDVVTVAYTKPAVNPLQNTSGGQAASMGAQTVSNSLSPASPAYVSSAIENDTPARIEITFNLSLANVIPLDTAFAINVNGAKKSLKNVTISGKKVFITLSESLKTGDNITVSYIKPVVNPLQTSAGVAVESILAKVVTNNISTASNPGSESDKQEAISVFPNPARKFLNIKISNPLPSVERIIRVFDFSGKLCLEKKLETGANHKLLIDLRSGFYILQIETGSMVKLVQKLIVVN